jgi:hypothetical protein
LCHPCAGIKYEKFSVLLNEDALNTCHYCYFVLPWNHSGIFHSNFLHQLQNPEFLAPSNSSRGNFSDWCVLRAAWPYGWRLFGSKNIDLMVHEFLLQGFNIWAERMKPVKPWQFLSGFFPLYFNFPSVILLLNSSVLVYYLITGNRRRVRVDATATLYRRNDQISNPGRARDFSFLQNVQTGSGAHRISCLICAGVPFRGGKMDKAW